MVPTSDKLAELAQIYSQLKRIFEPGRVIPARDTPDTGELKRGELTDCRVNFKGDGFCYNTADET